jgi:hypothetical protein
MDLLDEEGITDETLKLLENYWFARETFFETKMEAWKIQRAERFKWERPILRFRLIRHPGGLRRQSWMYNFDTDVATLISEGPIPQSKRYDTSKDAQEIVDAITRGIEHPCVFRKGDLIVINPRKISELMNAPTQTVESRVKRLKSNIRELMKDFLKFKETKYRGMLAYKQDLHQ